MDAAQEWTDRYDPPAAQLWHTAVSLLPPVQPRQANMLRICRYIQITPCTVKDKHLVWNLTLNVSDWKTVHGFVLLSWNFVEMQSSVSKVHIPSIHNSFHFYYVIKQHIQIKHLGLDFKMTQNACKKKKMHLSAQTSRCNRLDSKFIYSGFDRAAQSSRKLCNTWIWQRFLCYKPPWDPNDVMELVKTILNSTDEENSGKPSSRNKQK